MIPGADASLIGWLRFVARHDRLDPACIYGFLRHGRALCSAGGAHSGHDADLAADWRALAVRGVAHIGPSFDPADRMNLGGVRHETDRDEVGRRLFEDDSYSPPGTAETGLVAGPRGPADADPAESPTWWTWKREAADWSREHDPALVERADRFAAERARLRLELLYADARRAA